MTVENPPARPTAWQPFTPGGVASFGGAPLLRLWFFQLLFALLAAAAVLWFIQTAWLPPIRQAIQQLPDQGVIKAGELLWRGDSPRVLAAGNFLALRVDPDHSGTLQSPSQIEVEFGRNTLRIFSLFGYVDIPYPKQWNLGFNQADLTPWWGAWEPPILWMVFGGVVAGLLITWWLLASLYCLPVWLAALFANHDLDLAGAWKLGGAALLPGALLLTVSIVCLAAGTLDLVKFLAVFSAHWFCGWIYLIAGVVASPKAAAAGADSKNPFATEKNLKPEEESQERGGKR